MFSFVKKFEVKAKEAVKGQIVYLLSEIEELGELVVKHAIAIDQETIDALEKVHAALTAEKAKLDAALAPETIA